MILQLYHNKQIAVTKDDNVPDMTYQRMAQRIVLMGKDFYASTRSCETC